MVVVPVAVVEIMASDVITEDIGDSAIVSKIMTFVVVVGVAVISVILAAVTVDITSMVVAGDPVVIAGTVVDSGEVVTDSMMAVEIIVPGFVAVPPAVASQGVETPKVVTLEVIDSEAASEIDEASMVASKMVAESSGLIPNVVVASLSWLVIDLVPVVISVDVDRIAVASVVSNAVGSCGVVAGMLAVFICSVVAIAFVLGGTLLAETDTNFQVHRHFTFRFCIIEYIFWEANGQYMNSCASRSLPWAWEKITLHLGLRLKRVNLHILIFLKINSISGWAGERRVFILYDWRRQY